MLSRDSMNWNLQFTFLSTELSFSQNICIEKGSSHRIFTTCTNPIINHFYPPKICVGIVFDLSWDIFMSQEKLQAMVMQKFLWVIEVYYGIVQVVNC